MAAAGANAAAATAASAAAVFTELCTRFQLEDAVKEQIIATGVSTLSEFRHFVTQSSELEGAFITPIQANLANARLQLARLRNCWSAVCTAESQREGRASSTPLQLDEDDLLPSAQLTNIRDVFWARYKLVFPPEFTPSDRLLTKAQRALQKRSLEVMDIMRVKSISTQRMSGEKRRKVANNLWVGEGPDEIPGGELPHHWWSYLCQLRLYLLALAMAGASKIEPAPTAPESSTTNSCDYVHVPYDVVLKYLCRAESLCYRMGEGARLGRLEQLDRAERSEWAHRLANSPDTLGSIIFQVFRDRDSHWVPPPVTMPGSAHDRAPAADRSRAPRGGGNSVLATALRDGTTLCQAWQSGRCSKQRDPRCSNGLHRCAVEFGTGRVCGSPKHIGTKCPDTRKKQV